MDNIENTPGTAIVVPTHFVERRNQKSFEAGAPISAIVPRDLDELARVAAAIIKAGLAPDSYIVDPTKEKPSITPEEAGERTKARIMIGIMKGAEIGMPPITALSTIAIINNRPCVWGDGAVALIQSRNIVERWVETTEGNEQTAQAVANEYGELDYTPSQRDFTDDYTAVCTIWRKGQSEPYVGRFSVRDARRAGLWTNPKKKPWFEHPKRMLQWRARAYAMRDGFSDCLMGLAIREEIEDLTPEPVVTDTSFLDDAVLEPESVDQKALPSPNEESLPGIVIEGEKPKEPAPAKVGVEVQATQQGDIMVDTNETSKDQAPEIPSIEVYKPMGAKKVNWVRTREILTAAFLELPTVATCGLFRAKNSGTINLLRSNHRDEWDIFTEVAAAHERTLFERENPNTKERDYAADA